MREYVSNERQARRYVNGPINSSAIVRKFLPIAATALVRMGSDDLFLQDSLLNFARRGQRQFGQDLEKFRQLVRRNRAAEKTGQLVEIKHFS